MTDNKTYTHQSIAASLLDHGAATMFGLMGDANLFIVDHYVRQGGGTFIPVAYEGSAVLMALAWSHVTGKTGVATVTHGPALTNCVTALTEGARGRIPMVLLAGDTPVMNPHNLQNIDQAEVVRVTGAGIEQIRAPETASADIARAFERAVTESRPIVVNMPADFMWRETQHRKIVHAPPSAPAYVPRGDDLDEAVGMLASAKRPLILAGSGAIGARDGLIALAQRLEAPLATTLKAKGLFEGHPNDIGIFGTVSTPGAYEVIGQADCIACFGTSLHHFTTDNGKLFAGKRIVLVNDRRHETGRNYHADATLIADAGLTADNFVYWLDEAEIAPSGFVNQFEGAAFTHHPDDGARDIKDGCIDFIEALKWLDLNLPKDRLLTTDGGRFMTEVWCRIAAAHPRDFIATTHFGSIGLGLQVAIGAGTAYPERPVVLFTGDGGFMMGGINEFNTAVRMGLKMIVIVCNDAAYGAEYIQFADRQMDPGLSQFEWPSFADVAQALGGKGIQVRSMDDLAATKGAIDDLEGPLLIELRLDPEHVPRMRV